MAAPRAPAILLSLVVSASGLLRAAAARADDEPPEQDGAEKAAAAEAAATAAVAFPDERFGPRYVIDDVLVRGNHKTNKSIILAEAAALGLVQGAAVDASDPRVEAVRYRLLALGYFLDVRLSVTRGAARGGVVLVVEVEERGTIVINELFPSTSAATTFWGGADVSETNLLGHGINLGAGFVASTTPEVPGATRGLGLRLRAVVPPIGGPYGLSLSATGLYNDGSEFYRVAGADDDSNPRNFVAVTRQARGRRAGRRQGLSVARARGPRLPPGGADRRVADRRRADGRLHDQGRDQPARQRHGQRRSSIRAPIRFFPGPACASRCRWRRRAACSVRATSSSRPSARVRSSGRCRAGTRWGCTCWAGAIFGDAPYLRSLLHR